MVLPVDTVKTQVNVEVSEGPLLSRPPAADVGAGTFYYATDTGQLFIDVYRDGIPPFWTQTNSGASGALAFFVDAVNGNDANDGLTPQTAVQTTGRLLQLLPDSYMVSLRVYFAPGTYPWPSPDTFAYNPLHVGPTGEPVAWIGGMSTLAGPVALDADTLDGLTLSIPVGAFTTGEFDQRWVEFVDGATPGLQVRIVTSVVSGGHLLLNMVGSFSGQTTGTNIKILEPNVVFVPTSHDPQPAMQVSGTGAEQSEFMTSQITVQGRWEVKGVEFTPDRTLFKVTNVGGTVNEHARVDPPAQFDFMPDAGVLDAFGSIAAAPPSIGGSLSVLNYSQFYGPMIAQNVEVFGATHSDIALDALYSDNAPVGSGILTSVAVNDYADTGLFAPSYATGVLVGNRYRREGAIDTAGTDFDAVFQTYDRCHWPGLSDISVHDNQIGAVHAGDHSTIDMRKVTGTTASDVFGLAADGSSQILCDSLTTVAGSNAAHAIRLTANARIPWAGGTFYSYANLAAASNKTLIDTGNNQGNVVIQAD
jgi:hypothetical protein